MIGGLDFAVRYPFTAEAKKFMEGVELTDRIVELAVARIKKALDGDDRPRVVLHDSDKEEEVASFAAARMMLAHLRNPFLTNRFAVNESKLARSRIDKADAEEREAVARSFGIVTREEGGMVLDLPTYLKYSPRSVDYLLINKRLARGMVWIKESEKNRIVEEAVKKHIEKLPFVRDAPESIVRAGEKLIAELPKAPGRISAPLNVKDHPPCVEKLLESAQKHENIPHQARYYLATYLLTIKMPDEDIVQIFSNFPDYAEKITRYQVGQIKKKAYSVPACATVLGYGLCCAVCRIGSPLNWHTLDDGRKGAIRSSMAGSDERKVAGKPGQAAGGAERK